MKNRTIYLTRTDTSDQGTEGFLIIPWAKPFFHCFTLELPWRDNQKNISCIPKGKYPLIWSKSYTFKRMMFLINKVPNRTGIRIHSGNFAGDKTLGYKSDSLGCPLFGASLGFLFNQRAVLKSKATMDKFETIMAGIDAEIIIN